MLPHSGGTASYRFALPADLDPTGIRLGVETPELWRIAVNGAVVDSGGERWLDDHIRLITIGDYLKPGDNVVELDGHPFDVRREIDQIYLVGDFACRAGNPGFHLARARPLDLGSWRRQGCPFYDREVAYRASARW